MSTAINKKDVALIHKVTNEYYGTVAEYEEEKARRKQKQLEGLQMKQAAEQKAEEGKRFKGKHYVYCLDEPIKEAASKSEGNEQGALFILLHYMQLNKDGLLIKSGKPATISDIANWIGKSERQTQRIVGRLIEQGFITQPEEQHTRNTTYSISEKYFIMGTFEGGKGMFSRLFQTRSRGKLKNITLEDANILMKILPYFHYQKYYLCSNPYEKDAKEIHHLNVTELAEVIGVNRSTLNRHIGKLMRAGYIAKTSGVGNASFFKVNPDIMTRELDLNSPDAQVVRQDFAELNKICEKEQLLKELGL